MCSLTSQTLTFMPAATRPSRSQKAMNSRVAGCRRGRRPRRRARVAGVLHPDVVLVGEEVRHPVVDDVLRRASRAPPTGPARARWPSARRAGARTAGGRGWRRRPPRRRPSALARSQASTRIPLSTSSTPSASAVRGATPTPSSDGGALEDGRRRSCARARRGPAPSIASTPVPEVQRHAVLGVHVAVEGAELGAEHALQRHATAARPARPPCRAGAPRPRPRSRSSRAPTTTSRPPASSTRAQRVGVLERAQDVHAVEVGARDRRALGLGAGGEQQRVVVHALAAGEHDRAARRRRATRPPSTVRSSTSCSLVPAGVLLQVDAVALGLAAQVVLAQRRALVGPLGLGAQQHDAPVEALLAQRLDGLAAGHAGAHDDEGRAHVIPSASRFVERLTHSPTAARARSSSPATATCSAKAGGSGTSASTSGWPKSSRPCTQVLGHVNTGQPPTLPSAARWTWPGHDPAHVRVAGDDLADRRAIGVGQADRVPGRDAQSSSGGWCMATIVGVSRSSARRASSQARRSAPRRALDAAGVGGVAGDEPQRPAARRVAVVLVVGRRPRQREARAQAAALVVVAAEHVHRHRQRRRAARGRARTRCADPCSVRSPLTRTAPGAGPARPRRAPRRPAPLGHGRRRR